jgi:hypothetical protein
MTIKRLEREKEKYLHMMVGVLCLNNHVVFMPSEGGVGLVTKSLLSSGFGRVRHRFLFFFFCVNIRHRFESP